MHVCMCAMYACVCVCVHTYMCMHVYECVYMCMCVCVFMYVCDVYACVCLWTHFLIIPKFCNFLNLENDKFLKYCPSAILGHQCDCVMNNA